MKLGSLSRFQKVALAALLSVVLLMFVGAVVRATGAGMGCPDWPKCWGQYIPPTEVSQIDVTTLPMQRYKDKHARRGGNPDEITEATVLAEFNVGHTWTEFLNRMCSMPVGIFSLITMVMAFRFRSSRPLVFYGAFAAVVLVGVNAWMGMRIVYTGLAPGIITAHMALAMLLLCVQVYLVWAGGEKKVQIMFSEGKGKWVKRVGLLLFVFILAEGMMGSQVREMTDALQKSHADAPRIEWSEELEQTTIYLVHRSFSWLVFAAAVWCFVLSVQHRVGGVRWQEKLVLGVVLCQMLLGIILSNVGVLAVVQVLHIGLSSILVGGMFAWLLAAFSRSENPDC